MRKFVTLLGVGMLALNLSAIGAEEEFQRGYHIYQKICAACHVETVKPEEFAKIREHVKAGKKPPFKAPPMSEVSARVKKFYPDEEAFVNFVKDYITNPSKEKGVCMPMAYKLFGVMPAIGKNMKDEDKEAVAIWLYRRFNDSWEEFIKKHPH